ncbi:MAG: L,D-transpeptidase family protein [Anaerolineaceae bacterium]
MTDELSRAQQLLEQARIALQYNDRQAARRLAQHATQADPDFRDAWLFMAELSHGSAQKAYLEQASRLKPATSQAPFISGFAGGDGEEPVDACLQDEFSDSADIEKRRNKDEPTQPLHVQKPKRSNFFGFLIATILLSTTLISLLVWISLPTPTVSAIDHSSQRMNGELFKPSLTPTETPEPTFTPESTFTPEPTSTSTPEPNNSEESQDGLDVAAPEIPLNIIQDERWIDVDLTNQRTYAFEGSTLIRTFIVSTGTQYHPTITGQYHIYVKYRYDDMAGPGYYLPDVPYTMYFYKGYSLHGTYWHDNFGQPMSHGCINMTIPDSEWLFYWASVGTLVNIHY